jgi:hypothetical protein
MARIRGQQATSLPSFCMLLGLAPGVTLTGPPAVLWGNSNMTNCDLSTPQVNIAMERFSVGTLNQQKTKHIAAMIAPMAASCSGISKFAFLDCCNQINPWHAPTPYLSGPN